MHLKLALNRYLCS